VRKVPGREAREKKRPEKKGARDKKDLAGRRAAIFAPFRLWCPFLSPLSDSAKNTGAPVLCVVNITQLLSLNFYHTLSDSAKNTGAPVLCVVNITQLLSLNFYHTLSDSAKNTGAPVLCVVK